MQPELVYPITYLYGTGLRFVPPGGSRLLTKPSKHHGVDRNLPSDGINAAKHFGRRYSAEVGDATGFEVINFRKNGDPKIGEINEAEISVLNRCDLFNYADRAW